MMFGFERIANAIEYRQSVMGFSRLVTHGQASFESVYGLLLSTGIVQGLTEMEVGGRITINQSDSQPRMLRRLFETILFETDPG